MKINNVTNFHFHNNGNYLEINSNDQPVNLTIKDGKVSLNNEPLPAVPEQPLLPDVLRTPEAESLLAKLCNAGMLDRNWQSVGLSYTEKGTLIEYIAEKLDIRSKWKFFGALWQMDSETLRTSKARGLDQDKTWAFRSRLEAL